MWAVKALVVRLIVWIYSKIMAVACGGAPRTIPTMKNWVLMESGSSLAGRIRSREVTSEEIVRSYIERIREVTEVVNCVVEERFEAALAEAKKADWVIQSGGKTGEELERDSPLMGVPFSSPVEGLCRAREVGGRSAVGLMRAAGGIPIACSNVSERCLLWETNHPVFGRTWNPYDTSRSVGGPFGGEACLIAACGSPVGIAPSATLPCAFTGIFGHKPSEGASLDAAGPMSRSSADLLPVLKILTKNSSADLNLEETVDLSGIRYYFMDDDGGSRLTSPVDDQIKGAIQKVVHHFRHAVKASVERVELKQMAKAYPIWRTQTSANEARKLNLCKELAMALFGRSQHTVVFLLASLTEASTQQSQKKSDLDQLRHERSLLLKTFQDMLGTNGVFIYPTHPSTALRHNNSLARPFDFGYAAIFDALGLPSTHCPTGLHSDGLPIGFQVVAAHNQDRLTIAVAREVDKAFQGWTPPPTRPTFTLKNTLFHTTTNQSLKVL